MYVDCNVYRCISSTCAHVHMVVYKCMYIMNELSSAILSPVRADITKTTGAACVSEELCR